MSRGPIALMSAHRASEPDDPDFYPTPPWAARAGGELVKMLDPAARTVWEPACGAGHMAHGLKDQFAQVLVSDAYAYDRNPIHDFLAGDRAGPECDWVITNPPFRLLEAFIRQAWAVSRRGVAMLCRAAALESAGRYLLHVADCPLTVFAPFAERVPMHKGRWEPDGTTAAFYAWFIWLKPALRPHRHMARVGGMWRPSTLIIPPGTEARLTHPDDARLFGAVDRSAGGQL